MLKSADDGSNTKIPPSLKVLGCPCMQAQASPAEANAVSLHHCHTLIAPLVLLPEQD